MVAVKHLFGYVVGTDRNGKKVREGDMVRSQKTGNVYRVKYWEGSCCFYLETVSTFKGNLKEGIILLPEMEKYQGGNHGKI